MDKIISIFQQYGFEIIVVAIICEVISLIVMRRKEVIKFLISEETKQQIIKLILQAEKEIVGTKKGQERLEWCCEQIISMLPDKYKKYVSKEKLVEIINSLFETIAKKLDSGETKAME